MALAMAATSRPQGPFSFGLTQNVTPLRPAGMTFGCKGEASANTENNFVDPNQLKYVPGKIYSPSGTLSWGQRLCTKMILWYHGQTRNKPESLGKKISGMCPFPKWGQLSCSEYMLIAIQRLGVVRGLWTGVKRLLRCNPYTALSKTPRPDPKWSVA